jgi:hypothetical protein
MITTLLRIPISARFYFGEGIVILYRDNSIHFYNDVGFGIIIYNLAQASIKNYSDLLHYSFGRDLADEISLVLLPLSTGKIPIDPIQFIQDVNMNKDRFSEYVTNFIRQVRTATIALEEKDIDTARLMVTFSIKLESVKKLTKADVVVGVDNSNPDSGNILIKRYDPNDMLTQSEILANLPKIIDDVNINQYTFQAVVWENKIKGKPHLCWQDNTGRLTKYSPEIIAMIKKTTGIELQKARDSYSNR